jgi:GNAT superfamily N-acetyltransferase
LDIRLLTPADTDAILRLIELAGWNQTARDVERLLTLEPAGCFAAVIDGRVVGTTTTTTYGTELAWVGMVLVDPEYRRRGIAMALMEKALDFLRGCGIRTIKLDATPAGQPLYERLGFQCESPLERWEGTPDEDRLEDVSLGTWDDVAEIDRRAFGADRSALMRTIIADGGPPLVSGNRWGGIGGYAFARPGRIAAYVGPVVAEHIGNARFHLTTVAAGLGRVFIDIDPLFPGGTRTLRELGFTRQRDLMRMRLGPVIRLGPPRVFAIAGPEIG